MSDHEHDSDSEKLSWPEAFRDVGCGFIVFAFLLGWLVLIAFERGVFK